MSSDQRARKSEYTYSITQTMLEKLVELEGLYTDLNGYNEVDENGAFLCNPY